MQPIKRTKGKIIRDFSKDGGGLNSIRIGIYRRNCESYYNKAMELNSERNEKSAFYMNKAIMVCKVLSRQTKDRSERKKYRTMLAELEKLKAESE